MPARFGQRNRFDVADRPVMFQALVVAACFAVFGTHEETYLALYAAGVFVLLGLTGWASVKRLWRTRRVEKRWPTFVGTVAAASVTSAAAFLIFVERFGAGAWLYLVLVPILFTIFSRYRSRLDAPAPFDEHVRHESVKALVAWPRALLAVVDGTAAAETALVAQAALTAELRSDAHACCVRTEGGDAYAITLERAFALASHVHMIDDVMDAHDVARARRVDLLVVARELRDARELCRSARIPVLVIGSASARDRYPRLAHIVLGLDGSIAAEVTLPYASRLRALGAKLTILAVPDGDTSSPILGSYVERIAADLGDVTIEIAGSGPARTLVEVVETTRADLVIVASHGRGGTERARHVPLGSVPEYLLGTLDCSMLIIPATEFHLDPALATAVDVVALNLRGRGPG
ncbi:MAG: universal stress protein [Kofleriaceae bacterium]